MFHRANRVWSGATRIAVCTFLFMVLFAGTASQSYGYMPPPIPQPHIVPDEYPGEEQYLTGDDRQLGAVDLETRHPRQVADSLDWTLRVIRQLMTWLRPE